MGIDFQPYLKSIYTNYQHWWSLDTLTNTVGWEKVEGKKLSSLFDFGLEARIIKPKYQIETSERTEPIFNYRQIL
ncbi:hypothetical protein WJM97_17270 [Okeanomitos corallinicola TIOX110]|uniref:Uncharacterized protein n=1 Tax=Okeanomitos corallinicola TIOX110 TaxID=3133117 RepID=A0ABZ2UPB8_9CYAN